MGAAAARLTAPQSPQKGAPEVTSRDSRDALFFEFADQKLPIVRLETETLSLEEVFLKLTGKEEEEE